VRYSKILNWRESLQLNQKNRSQFIPFGQNDFWGISADSFASNIADVPKTIRNKTRGAEFLLVSTLRFDPAYTSKSQYWELVGQYAAKLKSMTGPGVQFVDMTAISESVFTDKKPKDCLQRPTPS